MEQCRQLYRSRRERYNETKRADVAQLVEQLIRNQQVVRSIRIIGSKIAICKRSRGSNANVHLFCSTKADGQRSENRSPSAFVRLGACCCFSVRAAPPLRQKKGARVGHGTSARAFVLARAWRPNQNRHCYPPSFLPLLNSGQLIHAYSWHNRCKSGSFLFHESIRAGAGFATKTDRSSLGLCPDQHARTNKSGATRGATTSEPES